MSASLPSPRKLDAVSTAHECAHGRADLGGAQSEVGRLGGIDVDLHFGLPRLVANRNIRRPLDLGQLRRHFLGG